MLSRAVVAQAYGGPEVLALVDVEVPPPGTGEVVIDVRAAGVNPADVKVYSGAFGTDPAKLPRRLGFEVAGVVTEVGTAAVGPAGPIAVGDEVIAYLVSGGYAQRLTAPATAVVPKPPTLSWEQAAGLLLVGVTAASAVWAAGVTDGDTVLVHGAVGGVGFAAVQLALAAGAHVIGTASPTAHDLLRDLGATPVAYGDGLAQRVRALAPDAVDAAIDTVGGDEAVDVSLELVADRGRIASTAAFGRADAGITILGGKDEAEAAVRDAARLELVELATAGRLHVLVSRSFALADAADSHRALSDRSRPPGKIVLVP